MNSLLLISTLIFAQPQTSSKIDQLPLLAVEFGVGALLSIFIHESAHYVAIKAYDDADVVDFKPYPFISDGKLHSGLISYTLSKGDNYRASTLAMAPAGMMATRLLSEGSDYLVDRKFTGQRADQFMAAVYFTSRFDMVFYILGCAIRSWVGHPKTHEYDPQGIMNSFTTDRHKQNMLYIGAASLVIADLIFDFDEVMKNWDRLWLSR